MGVAAAVLSNCSSQIGGVTRQGTMPALAHRGSGSGGALVYVSGGCGGVCVLSYPDGKLVSSISLSGIRKGACSDNTGNVFVLVTRLLSSTRTAGQLPLLL
jgi:hypothetical protein